MVKGRGVCAGCHRERSLVSQGLCHTCYRRTREKESCCGCGRLTVPTGRTSEGGWCERCRQHHLAEPCSRCGRTAPVALRGEDGRPVCKACYQREHPRPLRRCLDCDETKPVSRITDEGPLCEKCDNRRAPLVRCPRCGKTRKIGILSTGICRACAQQNRPRQPCRQCRRMLPVAYRDADGQPWCDQCRRRARPNRARAAARAESSPRGTRSGRGANRAGKPSAPARPASTAVSDRRCRRRTWTGPPAAFPVMPPRGCPALGAASWLARNGGGPRGQSFCPV